MLPTAQKVMRSHLMFRTKKDVDVSNQKKKAHLFQSEISFTVYAICWNCQIPNGFNAQNAMNGITRILALTLHPAS